jgi:hypothetical protein
MRPRKAILLFCADEQTRSVYAFWLTVRGFRILGGISSGEPRPDVALVIADTTLATANITYSIARHLPTTPLLVLLDPGMKALPDGYPHTAQSIPADSLPAQILERVRASAKSKCGPRPQLAVA